jgi:hypothetical protein
MFRWFVLHLRDYFSLGGQYGAKQGDDAKYTCKYSNAYWLTTKISLPWFLVITLISFVFGFVIIEVGLFIICNRYKKRGK